MTGTTRSSGSPALEPGHYKASKDPTKKRDRRSMDSLEVIDVIEKFDLNFHLGNIVKYICRHPRKGGLEDLKKARKYLTREINKREGRHTWRHHE